MPTCKTPISSSSNENLWRRGYSVIQWRHHKKPQYITKSLTSIWLIKKNSCGKLKCDKDMVFFILGLFWFWFILHVWTESEKNKSFQEITECTVAEMVLLNNVVIVQFKAIKSEFLVSRSPTGHYIPAARLNLVITLQNQVRICHKSTKCSCSEHILLFNWILKYPGNTLWHQYKRVGTTEQGLCGVRPRPK